VYVVSVGHVIVVAPEGGGKGPCLWAEPFTEPIRSNTLNHSGK